MHLPLPLTVRSKKVFELAFKNAAELGHKYIGTEHILLGILDEGSGIAPNVIRNFVSTEKMRAEVLELLGQKDPRIKPNSGESND